MDEKATALAIIRRNYEDLPTTTAWGLLGDPGWGAAFAWVLTPIPADIFGMDPAAADQWVLRCVAVNKDGECRRAGRPFEGLYPTEGAARDQLVTLGYVVALLLSSDAQVIVPTERADPLDHALSTAGWKGAYYRETRPDGVLFQLGRLPTGELPVIYSAYDQPPAVALKCAACGARRPQVRCLRDARRHRPGAGDRLWVRRHVPGLPHLADAEGPGAFGGRPGRPPVRWPALPRVRGQDVLRAHPGAHPQLVDGGPVSGRSASGAVGGGGEHPRSVGCGHAPVAPPLTKGTLGY